ncbi:MAG: tyrosine-type recombinase/integrase [Magnetococcales bacterium]|nr:tyrosine-type recombinase/integrase [Magnetococcales bacterium]
MTTPAKKSPLTLTQVRLLSGILKQRGNQRDLALFLVAFDAMLRASDLLALRLGDLATSEGKIRKRFEVVQQKTGKPVTVALTKSSEEALASWLRWSGKIDYAGVDPEAFIFTRLNGDLEAPISRRYYSRLLKNWASFAGIDPEALGTHSMRRTKAALIYSKTKNLRAVQLMLGQTTLAATQVYLGIEAGEAADLAASLEV